VKARIVYCNPVIRQQILKHSFKVDWRRSLIFWEILKNLVLSHYYRNPK